MNARFVASLLGLASAGALAQAPEPPVAGAPDLGAWVCRFCPFDTGSAGWVEPVAGSVSAGSFRFGDYTSLDQGGAFADLGGAWRYRDAATGTAWDLRAEHLGLESRAIEVRGGRQGTYRVSLAYASLEHLRAADARTPFDGGARLDLPAAWTTAGSTAAMPGLDASLRTVELRQRREHVALGFEFAARPRVDLRLDYRRDEVHGTGAVGGSFLTLAGELARPLDQAHDRIDASAAWRHASGHHAQLALSSAFFSNGIDALTWQNPYSGPSAEARDGRMAQAPDNRAWRLTLAGGSGPGLPVQLSGALSAGRALQDQRFLPATINPGEAVALPRGSLDGRVDTTRVNARASLPLGRAVRFTADVMRDDRDNRTPVAAYTQVVMDTFTGEVRGNAPYGYTRNRWRFSGEVRAGPRLAAGVDDDRRERRLYGTATTTERRYWSRVSWRPFAGADLRVRAATATRRGSEFSGAGGAAVQNALMRAFNTADRDRDEVRVDFSLAGPGLVTAFNLTWSDDAYPGSAIGRTSGSDLGYGTDLVLQPSEDVSIGVFASHLRQESAQSGSEGFGAADWAAQLEDTTNVIGAHAEWQAPRGLELGAGYTLATSAGSISMLAGPGTSGFPLQLTRWHDARLYGRYPLRPDLSLRLDVLREIYEASDWSLGGVAPDTVPNLLALGQGTGDGAVTAVLLGLRWQF
jgi:MtrB/PioB family decaheme-associated outer membrane protein